MLMHNFDQDDDDPLAFWKGLLCGVGITAAAFLIVSYMLWG